MSIYLSIQHTYHGIEAALFDKGHLLGLVSDDKKRASKTIIALLHDLLMSHQVRIQDLSFLAINQGPGPFTTLRVVIASVNGLSFATKKPLIGVDGLEALIQEHKTPALIPSVGLLNAFTQDVYFAIHDPQQHVTHKGYKNITLLLLELHNMYKDTPLYFIGNGSTMHAEEIKKIFGDLALFGQPMPEQCSIKQIGSMGYADWLAQRNISYQLAPLYLKNQFPLPG